MLCEKGKFNCKSYRFSSACAVRACCAGSKHVAPGKVLQDHPTVGISGFIYI